MSGNIHDTDTVLLRKQIYQMKQDMRDTKRMYTEPYLISKYNALYTTSKTLFDLVRKESKSETFDDAFFTNTVDFMLKEIDRIQNEGLSQHNASKGVGTMLADKYFPKNA